jgi:Aspartyl protease
MSAVLLGVLSAPIGADTPQPPPAPAPAAPAATPEALAEVIVQTPEPKYVAPTRRDRIGRIWAPVMIDGKGPFRLVLDTGATGSAITASAAQLLGIPVNPETEAHVTGFTGSAVVPIIRVDTLEVGELFLGPAHLPVLADVFGGAQGVLGSEGLANKRIYADFTADRLTITRSHGEHARMGFSTVPLKVVRGLLVADVMVGPVPAKAIIDTGAQGTVGNLALQNALMRKAPRGTTRTDIIGVTLDVQSGDYLMAPDIDFGGHMKVRGIRITFGDMYVFQHWGYTETPALTLGMDLLGTFDVLVIDYTRHELQIRFHGGSYSD